MNWQGPDQQLHARREGLRKDEDSSLSETAEATVNIELEPFYYAPQSEASASNGPRRVVIGSRYFWETWAPLLGPTLTVLITRLRLHCYYNRKTLERRDWCFPTQETLAREIGVSRWTVMRELKKPLAQKFVRVQHRSRYDRARRQTIRLSSMYHVAMDDPILGSATSAGQELASAAPRHVENRTLQREVAEAHSAPGAELHISTGPTEGILPPKDIPAIETLPDVVDDITRELICELISPKTAEELARQYPAELIREKVAGVHELARQKGTLRNAAGFLRRAIEEDYPLRLTGTDDRPAALLELRPSMSSRASTGPSAATDSSLSARTLSHGVDVDVWERVKASLRAEVTPAAYAQWVEGSTLLHCTAGQVRVAVADAHVQRYLQRRLLRAAEAALRTICGQEVELDIVIHPAAG